MSKVSELKRAKGHTLIEVLFALTLLFILLSTSILSLSSLLQKNEQQSLIDELLTAIQYAKLQALAQNQQVILKAIDSENWAKGMILVCGKDIVQHWKWHYGKWQMVWKGVNSIKSITFGPNLLHTMSNGRFYLQHPQHKNPKVIILNRMGRIKVVP